MCQMIFNSVRWDVPLWKVAVISPISQGFVKSKQDKVGETGGAVIKNLPANAGDAGDASSISGWGRSPDEGKGNPIQYSCLENSMDRGAWQATYSPWGSQRVEHDWRGTHKWNRVPAFKVTDKLCFTVQSLSCIRPFATPWTAEHQASLSFSISQSGSNSCPMSFPESIFFVYGFFRSVMSTLCGTMDCS